MKEITWQNLAEAAAIALRTEVLVQKGQLGIMGELSRLGFDDCGGAEGKRVFRRHRNR